MVPLWYWIVAGILTLWNAIGCFACYSQLTISAEKLAKLPDQQREAWATMPGFAKAAYVVAVVAGLAGAILLLLQNALALPLSILSLVGIVVQFGWFFLGYGGWKKHGASGAAFPAFIALVAIGQIAFTCCSKAQGWLI
jgi:hypothetical protein